MTQSKRKDREIHFKELANVLVGAAKSRLAGWRPRKSSSAA